MRLAVEPMLPRSTSLTRKRVETGGGVAITALSEMIELSIKCAIAFFTGRSLFYGFGPGSTPSPDRAGAAVGPLLFRLEMLTMKIFIVRSEI
jgi:hypothetical protein